MCLVSGFHDDTAELAEFDGRKQTQSIQILHAFELILLFDNGHSVIASRLISSRHGP